jgi:hypothetical protein
MRLIKPVHDFDFESSDGKLQYSRVQGTLEAQQTAFTEGGYSWLSASEVRQLIVDNPDEDFGSNWHRTGDGIDYVHTDAVRLYLSPNNRMLASGKDAFDSAIDQIRNTGNFALDKLSVNALVKNAKNTMHGSYIVDLDALEKNTAFKKDNNTYGHIVLSTTDYARQMNDDPNLASLVNVGFGSGQTLERTMSDLKKREMNETWAFTLLPEYVRAQAPKGTGVGRLSAVNSYFNYSYFRAYHDNIDSNDAFAFGVRKKSAEGGRAKK